MGKGSARRRENAESARKYRERWSEIFEKHSKPRDPDEQVYQQFVKTALKAKRVKHFKHWSARAVFHVMRWESGASDSDPVFKINSNKSAAFARRAMEENKELEGFFRLRNADVQTQNC